MKKFVSLILSFFLFFSVMFFGSEKVYAKSYSINKLVSTFMIQKNGDVKVTQDVTYNFYGDFNGIMYTIDSSGADGTEGLDISTFENGNEKRMSLAEYASNGNSGVFTYKDSGSLREIKIYDPVRNENKRFLIRYTLKNVVTVYNDTAEFNWKVIDKNSKVKIDEAKAIVVLPEAVDKQKHRIFTHGSLLGETKILGDGKTTESTVLDHNPGQIVETRVLFPKEAVPDSKKIVAQDKFNEILAEEEVNIQNANAQREAARAEHQKALEKYERKQRIINFGRKLSPLFILIGAIGAALGFKGIKNAGKEIPPEFTGEYYRELPEDYTPAVMSYLVHKTKIDTNDLMATIMNLANKGFIRIDRVMQNDSSNNMFSFASKGREDYILSTTGKTSYDGLFPHEIYVYEWFMKSLADEGKLSMEHLRKSMNSTSRARTFSMKFDVFKSRVSEVGTKYYFFDPLTFKGKDRITPILILLAVLGALIAVIFQNFLGTLIAVISIIFMVLIAVKKSSLKFSQYGSTQNAMWMAFKKFLLTFSNMEKAELPSLAIWRHYLVYATSLGVAKEVMDQLPKIYSAEELSSPEFTGSGGGFYMNPYTFGYFNSTLNSAVDAGRVAIDSERVGNSSNSSSGGFGGGFSSGSSGGGGGGGGFGAF